LLRESSNAKGEGYDLNLLTGASGDGNIARGALLVSFADAVLGTDDPRLDEIRAAIRSRMGDAALVDAAAIVATFNAIDRVADSTGIPIEDNKAASTADIRAALGINAFAEGARRDRRPARPRRHGVQVTPV
jgi:hypothetical protein